MQRRVADGLTVDTKSARRLRDQSDSDDAHARVLRDMIFERDAELQQGNNESEAEKAG
jgi:hypothetical protein